VVHECGYYKSLLLEIKERNTSTNITARRSTSTGEKIIDPLLVPVLLTKTHRRDDELKCHFFSVQQDPQANRAERGVQIAFSHYWPYESMLCSRPRLVAPRGGADFFLKSKTMEQGRWKKKKAATKKADGGAVGTLRQPLIFDKK
jgi:hypothetical protein